MIWLWVALGAWLAITIAIAAIPRKPNLSAEYLAYVRSDNADWQRVRRLTMFFSLGRDCIVPWLRATDVDHISYARGRFRHEVPWMDVVPLNRRTHQVVTILRRTPLRPLVNGVLRIGYGMWFAAWAYAIGWGLQAAGVVHGMPTLADVGRFALSAPVTAGAVVERGKRDLSSLWHGS